MSVIESCMGRGLFMVNKKFSALSNGKSRNTVNSQNHRHFSAQCRQDRDIEGYNVYKKILNSKDWGVTDCFLEVSLLVL